jgi:hypothetical protein
MISGYRGRPQSPRRSGSYVGAPVASLRRRILRTGIVTLSSFCFSLNDSLHAHRLRGITTLVLDCVFRWPLLKWVFRTFGGWLKEVL